MQVFTITKNLAAVCRSEKTRYGFRHLAELQRDNWKTIVTAKCCYYNRTWERYTYESVLEKLLENAKQVLTKKEYNQFDRFIKNGARVENDLKPLKTIANIARLGEFFGKTVKEKNDWKARMLKAGLENKGLIMPDNWTELSEAEKEKRLNGAIAILK